jgi:hypothetical protein
MSYYLDQVKKALEREVTNAEKHTKMRTPFEIQVEDALLEIGKSMDELDARITERTRGVSAYTKRF